MSWRFILFTHFTSR